MGYLLKTTTESIGNNKGSADRIGKEGALYTVLGNLLISIRKRNQYEQSLYMSRKALEVKSADIERNVESTVLQG
jgi:hypothetical protein